MSKNLWEDNDSILADCRFITKKAWAIESETEPNIPLLLSGRSQSLRDEVAESQSIVSVRIRVERAITRIKKFEVLNYIPLSLHGSVNQVR